MKVKSKRSMVFHSYCNLVNPAGVGNNILRSKPAAQTKLSDIILSAVFPRAHDQHNCSKVDHSTEMQDIFLFKFHPNLFLDMTLYHWSFSIFKVSGQKEKPLFHLFPMATIRNFNGGGKFVVHLALFNKNGILLPDDFRSYDVGLFVESIFDRKHGVDISTNHCNEKKNKLQKK